jgi:hypothetical protein
MTMVIVPALAPERGAIERDDVRAYAARAATTWVDAFLLSGSTTRGDLLSVTDRAAVIDLWLEHLPPRRLLACCWEPADVDEAASRGVPVMAVMRGLQNSDAALRFLASLPAGAYVYSHPMYSPIVFDAQLAQAATAHGVLPAGGKLAKIGLSEVTELRAAAGPDFALWDGRCRHIGASLAAGASGVIITPLSHLPHPFPPRDLPELQAAVDAYQAALDALPTRAERTGVLLRAAFGDEDRRLGWGDEPGIDDQVRVG